MKTPTSAHQKVILVFWALASATVWADAFLQVEPATLQWTVQKDEAWQTLELISTHAKEARCQIIVQPFLARHGVRGTGLATATSAKQDLLSLEAVPDTLVLSALERRRVRLRLRRNDRCPAGEYITRIIIRSPDQAWPDAAAIAAVHVAPYVAMVADAPVIEAESRRDAVTATARFSVAANVNNVQFFVSASPLVFRPARSAREAKAIPVDTRQGARICPASAFACDGGDGQVRFLDQSVLDEKRTGPVTFSSNDPLVFMQPVFVTAHWTLDSTPRPAGSYTGTLRLTSLVMPNR